MHRPAIGGVADGRLQEFVQVLPAMCGFSSVSHALTAPGTVTECAEVFSSAVISMLLVPVDRGGGRRPAGAVQRDHLARTGRRIEAEAVAADAG